MDTVQLDVTKEDSVAAAIAHVLSAAGAPCLQRSLDTLAVSSSLHGTVVAHGPDPCHTGAIAQRCQRA